jgi:hypothetical protein
LRRQQAAGMCAKTVPVGQEHATGMASHRSKRTDLCDGSWPMPVPASYRSGTVHLKADQGSGRGLRVSRWLQHRGPVVLDEI